MGLRFIFRSNQQLHFITRESISPPVPLLPHLKCQCSYGTGRTHLGCAMTASCQGLPGPPHHLKDELQAHVERYSPQQHLRAHNSYSEYTPASAHKNTQNQYCHGQAGMEKRQANIGFKTTKIKRKSSSIYPLLYIQHQVMVLHRD